MINKTEIKPNDSAHLRMWLETFEQTWPIAKLGRDRFNPAERFELDLTTLWWRKIQ